MKIDLDKLVQFTKNQGFIFQGSEIYGGLANTFDYGPLGVELKENIKKAWLKKMVQEEKLNVGFDSSILMNPQVWKASGHLQTFTDPLIDCKNCNQRYRADNLIEDNLHRNVDGLPNEELFKIIKDNHIKCPNCGSTNFTEIRKFNLMFKTNQGVIENEANTIYLRPETAQGIFVNFKNIQRTTRKKIPFGVGQVGKAFRNEITPGNFIFRTREFEQMELEFFCKPGTEMEWFNYWKEKYYNFFLSLGIKKEDLRFRDHTKEELSHYSNATTDIEYNFPWGFGELMGVASRTDYDLKKHQEFSKVSMEYLDPDDNSKYIPYVIEPSLGLNRLLLVILFNSYDVEKINDNDEREVLRLHPFLAPYKACVLPLIKKYHEEKALELYNELSKDFMITYDDSGNIGKRYRRQDAIGTPFVITIDDDTINNNTVTIRYRDTMEQIKVKTTEIKDFLDKNTKF